VVWARAGRPMVAGGLVLGLLLLSSGIVLGHAQVVDLQPQDGAHLERSPASVTITFNEPVGLAPGGLEVIDSSGAVVDAGEDVLDGPTISQPLAPLDDGWYLVTWGVVSEDGHIVRASSAFAVGQVDGGAPSAVGADALAIIGGAARAVGDLGLVVAVGAWMAWWLLRARRPAVSRLARGATLAALLGTVAWASASTLDGGTAWWSTIAAQAAIARLLLLVVAIAVARRRPDQAALLTAIALVTLAGGGHSGGDPVAALLLSAHLAAGAVWLGAAPAVLLVLRDRAVTDADAVDVVRGFSRLAGLVLVVVAGAGVALAWNLSDGLAGGVTPWALLLAAKVACVGFAALLGAWGRRHLGRDPGRRQLARLFALDASLLVLVVLLSAGLTLSGPHQGHAGHGLADAARCATTVGEDGVSLVATPGRAGTNELLVSGVPVDVQGITLAFRHELTRGGALEMSATPVEQGWRASGALPLAGHWDATISVRVDEFTLEQGTCGLQIAP
jgi:copper transport protein